MPIDANVRDQVADRLLPIFRKVGFDGASLADLSRATRLGRSSLYHHFPGGKTDMAFAVLDRVDGWMAEHVVAPLEGEGPARVRVRAMLAAVDTFYQSGRLQCILSAFTYGTQQAAFRSRLAASFNGWIGALATVLEETGVPPREASAAAERTVASVQGAVALAAATGDHRVFSRILASIATDLID